MLRIRLRRVGAKKQPLYRIVVAENEWPRDGRFLEILGNYNPRTNPETVRVDEARVFHWMGNGAQPTESVQQLLTKLGTLDRFARLKKGEALETLLAEAQTAADASSATQTRRTRPETAAPSKKGKAKTAEETEAAAA